VAQTQAVKAAPKRVAAKKTVTMQSLWRLVVWGATAAGAMLIAVLVSRSGVGSQRAEVALSSLGGSLAPVQSGQAPTQAATPAAARPFDAQAETKRLSEAVRNLTADNDQLKARLATVEHNIDDVTGSIARQVEPAKTTAGAAPKPWPDTGPPVPATPAAIAAVVAPTLPLPMEYGVDIGSALSIQALRARWAGIRSAHPQLFDGLVPTVTLQEIPRSNHPELRLVVGPLANADAAAKLCAALVPYRLFCEPTIFAGQHLGLE
jgi:hypothetical protein